MVIGILTGAAQLPSPKAITPVVVLDPPEGGFIMPSKHRKQILLEWPSPMSHRQRQHSVALGCAFPPAGLGDNGRREAD